MILQKTQFKTLKFADVLRQWVTSFVLFIPSYITLNRRGRQKSELSFEFTCGLGIYSVKTRLIKAAKPNKLFVLVSVLFVYLRHDVEPQNLLFPAFLAFPCFHSFYFV